MENLEAIELYSVPVGGGKYADHLAQKYVQQLDHLSGFDPSRPTTSKPLRPLSENEAKMTQAKVINLFAMRKRINGG